MHAVIDHVRHSRLLSDLDNICRVANIPQGLISQSAVGVCGENELEWVRHFRTHQASGRGLILEGQHHPSVEMKMMVMAAAFLRNFIDARVLPINTVLEGIEAGSPPDPTVLLIPNFHITHQKGRTFPTWKIQQLYDLMLSRLAQGKVNALHVSNWKEMKDEYGTVFADHLDQHYIRSQGE